MAAPENAIALPKWSPLGPSDAVGNTNLGRVNAIAFDPTNTSTVYIGSAVGGLWKSTTSGTAWTPLTDALPTLSIGDIAIDPTASNTIYIATGDAFGYGNPFWGGTYSMGVWKSIDGGHLWLPTGLTLAVGQTRTIRQLAINPTNPEVAPGRHQRRLVPHGRRRTDLEQPGPPPRSMSNSIQATGTSLMRRRTRC